MCDVFGLPAERSLSRWKLRHAVLLGANLLVVSHVFRARVSRFRHVQPERLAFLLSAFLFVARRVRNSTHTVLWWLGDAIAISPEITMWAIIGKHRAWPVGVVVLLAVLACWITRKSPDQRQPAVAPMNRRPSEAEVDFVYEQQESVGWVFGRMMGFQGADKPLLPRHVPPLAPRPGPSFPR